MTPITITITPHDLIDGKYIACGSLKGIAISSQLWGMGLQRASELFPRYFPTKIKHICRQPNSRRMTKVYRDSDLLVYISRNGAYLWTVELGG